MLISNQPLKIRGWPVFDEIPTPSLSHINTLHYFAMKRFFNSPSFRLRAHQLAIAMVVVSVLQGVLIQGGYNTLLFYPYNTLFGLELWRPFSSLLVATSPLEVIFGALIIYSIGSTLEYQWGSRRFLYIALGIPVSASLLTLVCALLLPRTFLGIGYGGAREIITTLWITYGLVAHFSHQQLNFWGSPLSGKAFALIGVAFVALNAVFSGPLVVLPELFCIALCYSYMYRHRSYNFKNQVQLKYYSWKLKRLKGRSGLRVIKGQRDDNDRQIH